LASFSTNMAVSSLCTKLPQPDEANKVHPSQAVPPGPYGQISCDHHQTLMHYSVYQTPVALLLRQPHQDWQV